MNPLFIIIAVLILTGGKLNSLFETLKSVDFNSFKPVFKLLGLNENITEFICSEKFSKLLENGFDIKSIPDLLSSADELFKKNENLSKSENSEKNLGLEPIKEVASTEIEESLGSFFT